MRHLQTGERFAQRFGAPQELTVYSPGRVNLIGEHTDYNDGYVFPAALALGTVVAARRREDGVLHTVAARMDGEDTADLTDLRPAEGPEWARFVRGVAALLIQDGYALYGADLYIDGDLPLSSGLSSSASLEVGVAAALLSLAGTDLDRKALARLGQRVEHEIIGVQCGIMDQLAVACGVAGHALLIDCRTLDVRPVPLPPEAALLVLDSAIPRTLAGSAYNQRRAECESALRKLQGAAPGLRALRDVTPELLAAEAPRLDAVELRRARHVVSENQRVLDSLAALQNRDLAQFGALMRASHRSLRDDYAVSSPDLDRLVRIANDTEGVIGARQTGGGFGGCAVALVAPARAEAIGVEIIGRYRAATGREGTAWVSLAGEGVRVQWQKIG
jgi:galactokinase